MSIARNAKIYLAGHRGLVGSALVRHLQAQGFHNLLLRTHEQLDLTRQVVVEDFFRDNSPDYVFLAAAKVGGIYANDTYPADFIRDNLLIQTNIIDAAFRHKVKKLVFLGSSCIYPKFAEQPIQESALLSGALEPTNEWYAVAKIAGIKMCQAYRKQYGFSAISLMPTNLYGPGDNFHPQHAHVLPALIRRFHQAKVQNEPEVVVWGTGTVRREFLHVDDLAACALFLLEHYDEAEIINVGTGVDVTIHEVAELVKNVVGYGGQLLFDPTKPDGTPRKMLDVTRLHRLGWDAQISLQDGLAATYDWFLHHQQDFRR